MTARPRPRHGEEGAALELALIFLAATALIVAALLSFASTSSNATTITRNSRGTDYDADATMQYAIATMRVSTTQGFAGTGDCLSTTPALTFNNPSAPLRVDCSPFSASASQRHVVLSVCTIAGGACTDTNSLLRADVIFYDDQSVGRAVSIQSWSNQ